MAVTGVLRRTKLDDVFPPFLYEAYRSTIKRSPRQELIDLEEVTLTELTGPGEALARVSAIDADLTLNAGTGSPPLGERIVVTGRILDEDGRPLPRTLVEIWQSNASGRYRHRSDQGSFPLDPNFIGVGRTVTDEDGRYRFLTVKPGRYPWVAQGPNVWRPAHIHFSVFGEGARSRLITQMYFPGDSLQLTDAIFSAVPAAARERLVSRFSPEKSISEFALGYEFDIVLRGGSATPFEEWREPVR